MKKRRREKQMCLPKLMLFQIVEWLFITKSAFTFKRFFIFFAQLIIIIITMNSESSNNSSSNSSSNIAIDFSIRQYHGTLSDCFGIAAIIIAIALLDTPCYSLVYQSRLKLIRVEFYILTLNSLSILCMKLVALISALNAIIDPGHMTSLSCMLFYIFRVQTFFSYLCVFFYYSLFHLASLKSANDCFRKFFDIIYSCKFFFTYYVSISMGYLLFLITYTNLLEYDLFTTTTEKGCASNTTSYLEIIAPLFVFNISFLTVFVYLVGIVLLVIWFPKDVRASSKSKSRIYRKNLVIFVKFFAFSCFSSILTVCLNFIFSIPFFIDTNKFDVLFKVISAFFNFSIYFHPIFFISTHNMLREKFVSTFCR